MEIIKIMEIMEIMETLQRVLMRLYGKTKKAGEINPGPAYRYRLINRRGFRALDVSTQKQHFFSQW